MQRDLEDGAAATGERGDLSRCLFNMPARVRFKLNDIHFNDSYFVIKLERRLNFD